MKKKKKRDFYRPTQIAKIKKKLKKKKYLACRKLCDS